MVNSLLISPLLRRGNTATNDLVKYKFSGRVVHFVGTAEWPLANKIEKDVVILPTGIITSYIKLDPGDDGL